MHYWYKAWMDMFDWVLHVASGYPRTPQIMGYSDDE